jgi:hypothetical protein
VNEREVSIELLQVKKSILNIINYVYMNRFLKENTVPTLHYRIDSVLEDDSYLGGGFAANMMVGSTNTINNN